MITDSSDSALTFERISGGAQVFLRDGSVWRAGLNYIAIAAGWAAGDRIAVSKKAHPTHDHEITNLETGETIRAVRSSNRI